jgi:DNA polymerase III subunit delta'
MPALNLKTGRWKLKTRPISQAVVAIGRAASSIGAIMSFKAAHALRLLDRARERGRLGHAYMVVGPKDACLEAFAVGVLNLVSGEARRDLDAWAAHGALVIRPESKSRQIKIEAIREQVEPHLNVTTSGAAHRFVIFGDAERLTVPAQNAFLRTLEEPPPRTLFLLLSERPEQFLETILSRVIRVPLMPEPGARKLNDEERRLASVLVTLSESRQPASLPGALAIRREFEDILDGIHARIEKQLEAEFDEEKKYLRQRTDVSGQWLDEKEKEMVAAVEARYLQEREALMELLLSWMGDVLRHQVGSDRFDLPEFSAATRLLSQRWNAATVNRCVRELRRLSANLHTNVQEGLALDSAFIAAFA